MKPCLKSFLGAAVAGVLGALGLSTEPLSAFPVITNVVETGGDLDMAGGYYDTGPAQWTGVTFSSHQANEPVPGLAAGQPYTVGFFGQHAPAYVDRNHRYTNAVPAPMPPYLDGQEYIMTGNDNRDNAGYLLDVYVATAVDVYLLIDNRLQDGNNADPPTFGPNMQWVVDEGWQPVMTGVNRAGDPNRPDEVGIDESANDSIDQYFSVYKKSFPAGVFQLKQADNAGRNMYGVVVVSVVPPATPTNLQAVSGDGRVTLSWSQVRPVTGYRVKRADQSGGPYEVIATVTTNRYVDVDVVNGQTYYYVVSAFNIAGESADSAEVIGQPKAAPRNVVAVGGTNQVLLSWDAFPGAASYTVKRSDTSGGPYEPVATGIVGTSYLDAPLASGRWYYYVVVAQLAAGGDSGQSDEAAALTVPGAPNLTVSLYAATVLRVAWSGLDPVVSEVSVERSTDGANFEWLATVPGSWNGYTNDGLAADTLYFYRVQAQNASGPSDYSNIASNRTPVWGVNVNFANAVNGQPANNPAPAPPGYLQDVGLVFGDRGNGYYYGWDRDITPDGRWRQNPFSPDLRWDTLLHFQKAMPGAVWEIEIPNGFYEVHLVGGDPSNTDQSYQYDIEGVVTELIPASGARNFAEFTVTCIVGDGRLTVRIPDSAGNINAKICFIDVYPAVPEPIVIATQPQSQTVVENRPVQFSVALSAGSTPLFYQWLLNGEPILGANSATLRIPLAQLTDAGQYSVIITNYAGSVTSAPATLVVLPDTEPPRLVSAGSVDGWTIGACYDELIDPISGTDPANYMVNGMGIVNTVTLRPDGRSVNLILLEPVTGPFTVQALQVQDYVGNFGDSEATNEVMGLISEDIGTPPIGQPGGDPQLAGSHYTCDNNLIEISGSGTDVWGTADGFRFVYKPVQGDFDAQVRVVSLVGPNTWTKAGLMARSSTNAGSRFIDMLVTPPANNVPAGQNRYAFQWRATENGSATWASEAPVPPPYPNAWMRLQRNGSVLKAYRSDDGVNWVLYSTLDTATSPEGPAPDTVLVGLFVTAHDNTLLATGMFANFKLVSGCSGQPPLLVNPAYSAGPPAQFSFQFLSESCYTYAVEACGDLAQPAWTEVQTVAGTGGLVTVTVEATQPKQFYRVRIR